MQKSTRRSLLWLEDTKSSVIVGIEGKIHELYNFEYAFMEWS
jgi:hypothetical protein